MFTIFKFYIYNQEEYKMMTYLRAAYACIHYIQILIMLSVNDPNPY